MICVGFGFYVFVRMVNYFLRCVYFICMIERERGRVLNKFWDFSYVYSILSLYFILKGVSGLVGWMGV